MTTSDTGDFVQRALRVLPGGVLGSHRNGEGLEFVVDSQVEGVEKPDPRIFRIALERLGVAASRALYVGDIRAVDEAGARAAGMHFVLIDPYGDYGDASVDSIARIALLPAWVSERFSVSESSRRGS